MSQRRTHLLVSICILLSLLLQPLSSVTTVAAAGEPTAAPAPDAPPRPGYLFRASVTLDGSRDLARLEALGVVVLSEGAEAQGSGGTQATSSAPLPLRPSAQLVVLADADQLAELARLGFRPRGADELRSLLDAQGPAREWLAQGLAPLLAQADAIATQQALAGVAGAAEDPSGFRKPEGSQAAEARASLHATMHALTPEQLAATADSISVDDDADGLTNTEEAWWCTDPLNPNSDGDPSGYTDGQEVDALLDFTLPRTTRWNYGPPFGPPAAWPNFNNRDGTGIKVCNDGDYDTIPDYAEAYMVGTSVPDENTDGDKFDDGQELFGVTYCPGGDTQGGWGNYPRTQDVSFITCRMPSWIRPPGDSPFVAAYPVIDFLVDPATIEVTTKEIRTIERTITQGEEISTGFAETQGNSTTVGTVDTNTHSTWQENSTTEGGIEPASATAFGFRALGTDGDSLARVVSNDFRMPTKPPSPQRPLNADDERAIGLAVIANIRALHPSATDYDPFQMEGVIGDGDFALFSLASYPTDQPATFEIIVPQLLMGVAHREAGKWSIYIQGTPGYEARLRALPDTLLSDTGKAVLLTQAAPQATYSIRGLPWKIGTSWRYNQGPHGDENAWDFGTPTAGTAADVYTAESGVVVNSKETCMAIQRPGDSLILWYQHIDSSAVKNFPIGTEVGFSQRLGATTTAKGCGGYSTGHHIHFFLNPPAQTPPPPTWKAFDPQGSTLNGWKVVGDKLIKNDVERTPNQSDKISHDGNEQQDKQVCTQQPFKSTDPNQSTSQVSTGNRFVEFFERIGQKVRNWFGLGSGSARVAGVDSFISGSSSTPLNYSDFRSDQQCGGSSSPSIGTAPGGGSSGLTLNDDGGGNFSSLRVWSQTQTNGEGWSSSHSELRSETQYSEITRSRTNTLVSSEAWSTATTVDPTDAAALTFNYNLYNTGSDAAVRLTGIKINILIGDLPVITQNLPDSFDILPGGAKGPFGSGQIKLTLDQLAAIDNGAPIRVVLADYGYDDNLYDANAWGRSVLFHVDDGTADGDETIDTYLITTNLVQGETYQDTLARYFAVTTFQSGDERNGTITGIRTPEFAPDGEITGWHDHPVDAHGWWELSISLGGETAGFKHFKEMPAKPKTDVYLRYVLDTDADGYTDRAERDAGSDPADPQSHPRVLLAVAQHTVVSGSAATVQVSLQNEGNFDASSVELWAVAPDDSITINDNLVGGGGRVRAGRQIVLGARIGKPDLANWQTSRAKPYPSGQFEGASAKTFTFRADATGNVGVTAGLTISRSSTGGAPWTPLAVGAGYTPWTALPLSDGLTIAFSGDYIAQGETFTFATALPIDTFSYTINRTPYAKPLLIASYNDPEGNHKFVSDVEVAHIQDDLASYLGRMRYGFQMDVMGQTTLHAGANTAYIVFNNPSDTTISSGNVFVEFATPDGVVAKEYVLASQTFNPGPNVATLNWDTTDFSPAFDPAQDYHILAFAADRQGTIFENTVKDLDQLGQDRLPAFAMADADATWDFGTAAQGTLLTRSFTFANTGSLDLLTYVSAPAGLTVSQTGSRRVGLADMTTYEMALNTANLGVGPYTGDITIRTSDPDARERTVHVVGTVTAAPADTLVGALQRPLDWPASVSGTQGQWVEFTHTLGPTPQTLHPVKVYSQDYSSLKGVGKYATSFGAGTASYDMFGDGRDGVMPSSGNLDYNNGVGVGVVNSGGAGSYTVNVTDAYGVWRINPSDAVLIHQTQGTGAGCWEINRAVSDFGGGTATYQLQNPLKCNYASGGNNHAQIQRVPQYTTCPVSGTVTPLAAWNGSWGGIFAVMCRDNMTVTGVINASGAGYRGGQTGTLIDQSWSYAGEGFAAPSIKQRTANGNGGGGGKHKIGRTGGGGGGGSLYVGADGWQTSEANDNGYGGSSAGNPELTIAVLGGGGGGGGHSDGPEVGGVGGNGGGLILLHAAQLSIPGLLAANGTNGTNASTGQFGDAGGGGGGAGGVIRVVARSADIGSLRMQVSGGEGGISPGVGGRGGGGSIGRIRIEYCESLAGTTNPPASSQKLNCYIADQAADPTRGLLQLPASGPNTYQVQYGRKLNWSGAANQVTTLRVPAGIFTSVTLQALVSDLPSNASFVLDVGNTGGQSWASTVGNGGEYTSPNLAAYFNAYWASHGAPTTGTLDVPIRVYLDRAGQVLLTNLQVTPTGSKARAIRLPVRPQGYSSVTANFTVSNGTGPLAVGVDVGGDGTIDWTYTGAPAYPAALATGNLATAINAYLSSVGGQPSADVPLRFYLSPFATLNLTGFSATPVGGTDASIGAGDITFSAPAPTEGNEVTVNATLHNGGTLDTGPLTVSFYATPAGGTPWYIGSAFVPSVPASSQLPASIAWNTLGFTGETSVQVTVDPFNRVAEASEANNQAAASLTIKTRPDLSIPTVTLSDPEPTAGEPVTVTLTISNAGQTTAGGQAVVLADGHPDAGGTTVETLHPASLPGGATTNLAFAWTPTTPGRHRLFARTDRDGQVSESDETNNDRWLDVHVGFASPLQIDSGGGDAYDPAYSAAVGFGYLDGEVNTFCGAEPGQTQRSDFDGTVQYRFDHLLPGHFYHLDLTLYECDGLGRQQQVRIDDNLISSAIDLSDLKAHRLSFRLDPAFYADRSIVVSVEELTGYDALVSEINLYDIDYRYADAGAGTEPAYSAVRGYGWLDGLAQSTWGTLPYQTRRIELGDSDPSDDPDNELRYRFDGLRPNKRYQLLMTVYQGSGTATVQQTVAVDSVDTGVTLEVTGVDRDDKVIDVPPGTYTADSAITVRITRLGAAAGAFVSEIALEELTLLPEQVTQVAQALATHTGGPNWFSFNIKPPVRPAAACTGVTATSAFTSLYGAALLGDAAASVGTIIEAYTPGGAKAGCFKVAARGLYGYMRVYGAEGATPGMHAGEPIIFKINGIAASPTPYPVVWQDDKATREVDLNAQDVIPVETLLAPIAGKYTRLQCETGTYLPPPADPRFNTCTTVTPGQNYLLWMHTTADLMITGNRVAADQSISLHAGYNWLGYLPTCELTVATALAGIAGKYDLLHSEAGTYKPPPADPAFNNFNTLAPGRGYMIHMTQAATLIYPANACGAALNATSPTETPAFTCSATPTSRFTHFYGHATKETGPLPAGAIILAYSPRGEVAGCGQVQEDGLYPYLRVYGAEGDLPGLLAGEAVRFTVNGLPALASAEALWQDDWAIHSLDLLVAGIRVHYLPLIMR